MLQGVGFEDKAAQKLKIRLIRKLTDTSHNLQTMAIVSLKKFLAYERSEDDKYYLMLKKNQETKERILRRIMNSNIRFEGMAFRQALQHTLAEREREIALAK